MDGTRPQPLTEGQLDRELETALGVEPSSAFMARVRTRVATEPEPSLWRLAVMSGFSRTLRTRATEPLWGVAIAGIVLAVLVPRLMREELTRPFTVAVDLADPTGPIGAGNEAEPVRKLTPARSIRRPRPQKREDVMHTLPLQLSPVLFAEDDRRLFALFVTAVNEGTVPEEAAQAEQPMTALVIEPLEIAPLQSLARVAQEGVGQWE